MMNGDNKEWLQSFFELLTANKIDLAQQLKFQHLPSSLFKYREFDKDGFSIKNLAEDSLWASSASKFNDPYDSFFKISQQKIEAIAWLQSKEKIKKSLQVNTVPFLTAEEIDKAGSLQNVIDSAQKTKNVTPGLTITLQKAWDVIYRNFLVHKLRPKIQDGMGVCSLSEVNTSMIMWRYYGGNHGGFCIEYDLEKTKTENPQLLHALYPVHYVNELPDMTEFFVSQDKAVVALMGAIAALHKSDQWSYEKEWRFIFPFGKSKIPFAMKAPKIKAVYLGMNISEKDKKLIIGIAQRKNIEIYLMHFLSHSYHLGHEKVSS